MTVRRFAGIGPLWYGGFEGRIGRSDVNNRARMFALAMASGLGLVLAQPALAAGGGGGGSIPSSRAPEYDPAEEFQAGVTAYQAQDYKGAAVAFKRVVAVVPKHAPAQYLLGASYIGQGNYKKARRPLEMALKHDDTLVEAHRDLAITYARLALPDKAAEEQKLLSDRLAQCAATCADAAKLDAAVKAVAAELAGTSGGAAPQALGPLHPPGPAQSLDATYVAAVALINEGGYAQAITQLEQALWSSGPHPDILTYLGFANRKLKRYDVARGWYEMALSVAPHHLGALEYYGELKLEMGDRAGARDHLARLDSLCAFGCQQADELRRWLREASRSGS